MSKHYELLQDFSAIFLVIFLGIVDGAVLYCHCVLVPLLTRLQCAASPQLSGVEAVHHQLQNGDYQLQVRQEMITE